MDVTVRVVDLTVRHPNLLWDQISAALVAVLGGDTQAPLHFEVEIQDVPGFGSGALRMILETDGVSAAHVAQLRRTYEASRLVELAGIAIAGLGLYHAGRHEIRDVALRGSAADYLVDEANHLLEIAGRSRRSDFNTAWEARWERLSDSESSGYSICVAEFQTPAGRLAFRV